MRLEHKHGQGTLPSLLTLSEAMNGKKHVGSRAHNFITIPDSTLMVWFCQTLQLLTVSGGSKYQILNRTLKSLRDLESYLPFHRLLVIFKICSLGSCYLAVLAFSLQSHALSCLCHATWHFPHSCLKLPPISLQPDPSLLGHFGSWLTETGTLGLGLLTYLWGGLTSFSGLLLYVPLAPGSSS